MQHYTYVYPTTTTMKFSVFAIAALAATSSMFSAAAASRARKLEKKNGSSGGYGDSISSSTTLTVTNQTPTVHTGATIYDPIGQTTISVFGASCPDSGCVVPGGASKDVGTISTDQDRTNYLLGLQWNISRMAPSQSNRYCDNACRQLWINLDKCTVLRYETETTGYCYTHKGVEDYCPRWNPTISTSKIGTTCTLTVTKDSVLESQGGRVPDTCGCNCGQTPCTCGHFPDDVCVGQCSDEGGQCNDQAKSSPKPDGCCFCKGNTSGNTCPAP